jgi:site-specific recombinase XerD
MLNNGAQMAHIQQILGHESITTTSKIYAHYDVKNLRAAFDAFAVEDPTAEPGE